MWTSLESRNARWPSWPPTYPFRPLCRPGKPLQASYNRIIPAFSLCSSMVLQLMCEYRTSVWCRCQGTSIPSMRLKCQCFASCRLTLLAMLQQRVAKDCSSASSFFHSEHIITNLNSDGEVIPSQTRKADCEPCSSTTHGSNLHQMLVLQDDQMPLEDAKENLAAEIDMDGLELRLLWRDSCYEVCTSSICSGLHCSRLRPCMSKVSSKAAN